MLLRSLPLAAALSVTLAAAALAEEVRQQPHAVIELFTSQGCAQCPAADAMFKDMHQNEGVIALAYHVDYWDYIGWPDTFGSAENSDRQRAYAESWNSSRIFTPQLVVNGTSGVVASRQAEVGGAMDKAVLPLPVRMSVKDDMLDVLIAPRADQGDAVIWLVTFLDKADVMIERGENEGKTVSYTQIVTGRQLLGMYESDTGAHFKLPLGELLASPTNGVAVLVQQENGEGLPGPIVGAASYTR